MRIVPRMMESRTRYMGMRRPEVNTVVTMSAKSAKSKPKGTSVSEKDGDEIIAGVQAMYDRLPGFIRPMLPPLPDILRRIPASAGKYTLNEIIDLLDSAYESGRLKR